MHALCCGCVDSCSINTPPSFLLVKVLSMATVGNEELQRASEELSSFQSFMAPSLDTPTTATSSQAPEMPVDSTAKRGGNEDTDRDNDRAKWRRGQGKGTNPKRKGKQEYRQDQKTWWENKDNRGYSKNEDLKSVVKALGKLVLRQEDSLSVIQLDCQFVIFMKNHKPASTTDTIPDWTVTSQLLAVGNHWRSQKERDLKSLSQPLRTVLFSSWLTAIRYRIDEFTSKPGTKEQAKAMGILVDDQFPPAMESRGIQTRQGVPGPLEHRGDSADPCSATAIDHPSQHDREVPPIAQAVAGNGQRRDPLDARNPKQKSGSPSGIPVDQQAGEERCHAPSRLDAQTEQARKISLGDSRRQDASRTLRPEKSTLLQLILPNPNEFSYSNAVLHSILWASSCSQDGLCVDHAGLFKFLQWLSVQHKPQPIWDNIAFRAIAKQWSQPLRSQDPAAFLQFLQPMLFAGSTGLWQSRAYPEPHSCVCEIVQCGKAWPIKMPEVLSPDSPCSLQSGGFAAPKVQSRWQQARGVNNGALES